MASTTDVALCSELLTGHGFRHGFSLRTGGVSRAPFDTLNLGGAVGDAPSAVDENRRRFAKALGVPLDRLYQASQVHRAGVRVVGAEDHPEEVVRAEADALVVPAGVRAAVGVRVADCVPVLLADASTGAVAAVHVGWRGAVARVLDAALDALGADAGDVLAAIGPHIRVGAFEVGDDVADRIAAEAHGAAVVVRGGSKPHVDLARVVQAQLAHRGIDGERVDDVGGCTLTEPERYFSYRRDGRRSGRHVGAIVARVGAR